MMKKLLKLSSVIVLCLSFALSFLLNVNAAETIDLKAVKQKGDQFVNIFSTDGDGDGSTMDTEITNIDVEKREITVQLKIANNGSTELTKNRTGVEVDIALTSDVKEYYNLSYDAPSKGETVEEDKNPKYDIQWRNFDLNVGEEASITYRLTLKEGMEKEVDNKTMLVLDKANSQVTTSEGTNTSFSVDENCNFPSFILTITVDNSQTGVFSNYIFIGLGTLAAIALIIAIRRKTDISKI